MKQPNNSYNNRGSIVPELNRAAYYSPVDNLEKKALFLEETRESLSMYRRSVASKLYRAKNATPSNPELIKELKAKLDGLEQGENEVTEKCLIIWKDIHKASLAAKGVL